MAVRPSLILNTACMDPLVRKESNDHREATYAEREQMLRETIEQMRKEHWHEIIVVGQFEEGPGYTYIEVDPYERTRVDALVQREQGARYSTGDVLVFCHDDHRPADGFPDDLGAYAVSNGTPPWDILVPQRVHFRTREVLNNGKDDDYMGGHCLVMKRWVWAEVPWTSTMSVYWDVHMTRIWREAGAVISWTDFLDHFDVEAAEGEL